MVKGKQKETNLEGFRIFDTDPYTTLAWRRGKTDVGGTPLQIVCAWTFVELKRTLDLSDLFGVSIEPLNVI